MSDPAPHRERAPPPADGHAGGENARHARHHGLRGAQRRHGHPHGTGHDDDQARRRDRNQLRPNPQDSRQDQPQGAEHFGHADEPEKQAGQGHLLGQGGDRAHELHSAGEEEQRGEEGLDDPEQGGGLALAATPSGDRFWLGSGGAGVPSLLPVRRRSRPQIDTAARGRSSSAGGRLPWPTPGRCPPGCRATSLARTGARSG